MRAIAPAIALGNNIVHKPDIQVGLSGGSIIAKAFEYAGLLKGCFRRKKNWKCFDTLCIHKRG